MPTTSELPPTFTLPPFKESGNTELSTRIEAIRRKWGERLMILGHHYQQDEVIAHSDLRGDSLGLSQKAAASEQCRAIAFCGVHFMAETADILANRPDKLDERGGERVAVVLPDMAAGCSMADMAQIDQVEAAWAELEESVDTQKNNSRDLHQLGSGTEGLFVVVTVVSSVHQAMQRKYCSGPSSKAIVFSFFPISISAETLPSPWASIQKICPSGIRLQIWVGEIRLPPCSEVASCSGRGTVACIKCSQPPTLHNFDKNFRKLKSWSTLNVHARYSNLPMRLGRLQKSSTRYGKAPAGTQWAIGTELHLVNRLKHEHPEQEIHFLSPVVCMCATMYRIDLAHLCWALENLDAGTPVGKIEVDPEIARWSLVALERMLKLS